MDAGFAEVAVKSRLRHRLATLTYGVPGAMDDLLDVGQLVWVPLKHSLELGIVAERHSRPQPPETRIRDIHAVVEPAFCLSPLHWQLAVWIAETTVCSLYEASSLMLPPGIGMRAVEHLQLRVTPEVAAAADLTPRQRDLMDFLLHNDEATLDAARKHLGSSLTSIVPALEERGLLTRIVRVLQRPERTQPAQQNMTSLIVRRLADGPEPGTRTPRLRELWLALNSRLRLRPDVGLAASEALAIEGVTRDVLRRLANLGTVELVEAPPDTTPRANSMHTLSPEQSSAWTLLAAHMHAADTATRRPVLLHGVTGSGKTELYLRAAADVLAHGRSVIILAPEIALSSQLVNRVRARFGDQALILHSALRDRERDENWRRAATGEPLVIVGPRSALFAPLPNCGLIVIDEEHDAAYKQDNVPRYHARAVAERFAQLHGAVLVLGSATPDVETTWRAERYGWLRLTLRQRVGGLLPLGDGEEGARPSGGFIPLPETLIVDMRQEYRQGNSGMLSHALVQLITDRVARHEQVLLFLNRRGASTLVQCRACGHVASCPFCDIPLVFHRDRNLLLCHRCGTQQRVPTTCPECAASGMSFYGAGTQRIAADVAQRFPDARVMRWDQDALRGGVRHEDLLEKVLAHDVDIVVGTQMIAKGLDLPLVTAVGVVSADTWLHLPDIRAAERTFQMITQVAGRAGRRAAGGEVVIQTWSPDHYAITAAARHDDRTFTIEELAYRQRLGYPPFKRLARLLVRHTDEDSARNQAEAMTDQLADAITANAHWSGIDVLGPAPAFAARLRGRYGWQIILRGERLSALLGAVQIGPQWMIDIDPVSLL